MANPKKSFYDKKNYEKKILISNIRKSNYISEEEGYDLLSIFLSPSGEGKHNQRISTRWDIKANGIKSRILKNEIKVNEKLMKNFKLALSR